MCFVAREERGTKRQGQSPTVVPSCQGRDRELHRLSEGKARERPLP